MLSTLNFVATQRIASSSWNHHINRPLLASSLCGGHKLILLSGRRIPTHPSSLWYLTKLCFNSPNTMMSESALVPGSRVFHFPACEGAPTDTNRGCGLNTLGLDLDWCRRPRQAGRSSKCSHLLQPQKKSPPPRSSTQLSGSVKLPGRLRTFCTIRCIMLFSNGKEDVLFSLQECFSS